MNSQKYKEYVEEGDLVIFYLNKSQNYAVRIKKGEVFENKYGALRHDNVIGTKYGNRVNCAKGFLYILFPTPELWTFTRLQSLQTSSEVSLVLLHLRLPPGSVVCHAGIGDSSLPYAFLPCIAPHGRVHTFDSYEHRVNAARREFSDQGLLEIISVEHRDVATQGFGLENLADAILINLPHPWEAIHSAKEAFKNIGGGRLCVWSSTSPDEVRLTCLVLAREGFLDIVAILNPNWQRTNYKDSMEVEVSGPPVKKSRLCLPESCEDSSVSSHKVEPTSAGYLIFASCPPRYK